MAVEKQSEKSLEAMMKNLKVDTSSEVIDSNMAAAKDGSPFDDTSCISSSGDATSSFKESDLDQEYLMAEQGMYYPACNYYGYCYPGYDSSFCEWDDSGYFLGPDGMDVQYPAIQADNGPLVCYIPGVHPGYNPYGPCMPGAMIGADGQYLGQPSYLPGPVFPQPLAPPGYFHSPVQYGSEAVPPFPWESSLFIDGAHGNAFCGAPAISCAKPNFAAPNHTLAPLKPAPPSKSGIPGETKGSSTTLDVPVSTGVLNQPLKPLSKVSQPGSGFQASAVMAKGYFPISKFPSCPSQGKGGLLYPNNPANVKANGRGWSGTEKLKIRSKVNGISDIDLLNEQNRGPRTNVAKNTWVSVVASVEASGAEINPSNNSSTTVIRRDQYNLSDFTTKYDDALFFVIKSYSEDDVHKSVKYNVWASTQGGNKRLDSAYQAAQERIEEKRCKCPVFLLFSVNASGQFCGVAEMTGRVDFNKSMNFWQQDKWNGFFPVKWHIIKDVPNPQFRHIILENNENKPVTNSRDTQEVKLPQGIEMLNIFKNYPAKTSILDDFDFYESRQKAMQDRRSRPPTSHLEHLQQKPNQGAQSIETADQKPAVVGQQPLELAAPSDKAEAQASSESKAKVEA